MELRAGMKISLILASTVEILRRLGNAAEEGCENRHGREVETEEEKEMVAVAAVALARNGDAIVEREREKYGGWYWG